MPLKTSGLRHNVLTRRRLLQVSAAAGFAVTAPSIVRAQAYPSGPITMIIPVPAGGVLDVLARAASDRIQKDWGHPFVVENVPGGTSNIGAARVARARPDGMTVLLTVSSPIVTNIYMVKDMPFDPDKDLAPVIVTAQSPLALVVHKSVPVRTLQEYIAYAKANPGKLTCGNSGPGSPHHLSAEYLTSLTNIEVTHIPYKGSPASIADVVGGHVSSAVVALGGIVAQAKAGDVRILALTDDQRAPAMPDVPTIGEIVPGFAHAPAAWNGLFVPAKTPREIINKLNAEMNLVLKEPELVAKLKNLFLTPIGGTPEAVTEKIKSERVVAHRLITKLGLMPK